MTIKPTSGTHPTTATDGEDLTLTPTEDLLLSLLAAHHRLGVTVSQIPTVHRKALDRLVEHGLVEYDSGNIERHVKVWLTEAGMVFQMSPTWRPPALAPICPSFYIGPATGEMRVDCRRRNHHKGKHKADWYKRKTPQHGPVKVVETTVTWTDDEAQGLASERFGPELRQHQEDRAARIAAARVRFGKPVPDPATNPPLLSALTSSMRPC